MGFAFIPFFPILLLVCYVPLWIHLQNETSLWMVFKKSWVTQFVLSIIGFYWIAYVSKEFGYLPWPAAILALILFASFIHLYIPLSITLAKCLELKFKLTRSQGFYLIATLMALFETYWPAIFPWNLGYPLLQNQIPIVQWADVVGFTGLSLFLYLTQAFLAQAYLAQPKLRLKMGGAWLGLALILCITGWYKKNQLTTPDKHIHVLQIQANIGNLEKTYAERGSGYQQFIADEYFNLTREALKNHPETELIIWPESAYPTFLNPEFANTGYAKQFYEFIQEIKTPIVTGAYSRDMPKRENSKDYNALFAFSADGVLQSPPYHKTYLLIFGETIPFVDQFPWLAKYNPGGAGFGRGPGPTILNLNSLRLGAQICYESLYPHFSTLLAQKGAQILVNVTNDSWFGPTSESYQHLYMTLARAIEVRLPLIRSTNTGITSAITASGDILSMGPRFEKWYHLYKIPYTENPKLTFYARHSQWVDLAPILVLIILGILTLLRKKKGLT